ncbi:MAG: hypothetical protein AAGK01_08270 [Pseudomonadota bacterium]
MKRGLLGAVLACATAGSTHAIEPSAVYSRLSDRYTEAQREAWFDTNAKGQRVAWRMRVEDVSKGWWNYDITGKVGSKRRVLCKVDISDENTRRVAAIGKGDRITCAGEVSSYVRFVGVSVLIDDADIE